MRTLILLYAYKAYPKEEMFSLHFIPTPLPFNEDTYYGNSIYGDCYITIAKRWLEAGYVDAVKGIAIQYLKGHPRYSPAGVMRITEGFEFYILEDISQYPSIHSPSASDILFIRGHPPWEPIIKQHTNSFKIFYSGGADLKQWLPRYPVDVVLIDDPTWSAPNARCIELVKCCDEEVFQPLGLEKIYDICFIARFDSQDKKGQISFAKLADKRWRTVFVGEIADGDIVKKLKQLWPSCEIVKGTTKTEVNTILNKSKVSIVFAKAWESGTRNITESLAAGTPVVTHKRNIGRKYITPLSGEVSGSFLFRWKVGKVIRNYHRYQPRAEYERLFHSKKVAKELWEKLRIK
jgi:glycosyltransferase involved in cell wall biosynthesis